MNATLTKRLERLSNLPTRYELVATHPDGRRVLLAYSMRKSRTGIYHAIVDNEERRLAFIRLCGPAIEFAKRAADGMAAGEWHVNFTGRTQRDAILSSELPYVEDVAA